MSRIIAAAMLGVLLEASLLRADFQATPVHPAESAEQTWNERLSLENALQAMAGIRAMLGSFAQLNEACRSGLSAEKKSRIGNMNPEMQTIAMANLPRTVEATLRKQDFLIKKLEFELASLQSANGTISRETLEGRRLAKEESANNLEAFWRSFRLAD